MICLISDSFLQASIFSVLHGQNAQHQGAFGVSGRSSDVSRPGSRPGRKGLTQAWLPAPGLVVRLSDLSPCKTTPLVNLESFQTKNLAFWAATIQFPSLTRCTPDYPGIMDSPTLDPEHGPRRTHGKDDQDDGLSLCEICRTVVSKDIQLPLEAQSSDPTFTVCSIGTRKEISVRGCVLC